MWFLINVLEDTTAIENIFAVLDAKKSAESVKTAIVFVQILKMEYAVG